MGEGRKREKEGARRNEERGAWRETRGRERQASCEGGERGIGEREALCELADTKAEGARCAGRGSRRRNVGSPLAWSGRGLGRRGCGF